MSICEKKRKSLHYCFSTQYVGLVCTSVNDGPFQIKTLSHTTIIISLVATDRMSHVLTGLEDTARVVGSGSYPSNCTDERVVESQRDAARDKMSNILTSSWLWLCDVTLRNSINKIKMSGNGHLIKGLYNEVKYKQATIFR